MRRSALALVSVLFVGLAGPAQAQPTPVAPPEVETADLAPLVGRLIDGFLRPAHADLLGAARAHEAAWRGFCAAPERAGLERISTSFRRLADAWARVEFVRYGPIAEDFRAERINFWPDKRNATTRGLAGLLAPDAPEPTVAVVRATSAAAQGLPALERLLFDPGAADRLVAAKDEGARACAVGRAIAGNVAEVAQTVAAGWEPLAEAVKTDPVLAREVAARLTTDLLTEFQTLIDAKLLPAMGKTIEAAKPEALEGRRAGRVRESFVRPLEGLEETAKILAGSDPRGATVLATLATARSIAEGLPDDFGATLAQPKRRSKAILLLDGLRAAQDAALADLPPLVGITVGFNSRDGD